MKTLRERIEKNSEPCPMTGCWLWKKSVYEKGYGRISVGLQRLRANRVSWEVYRGAIPDGMIVCHHCDVPSCVNPAHLFLGTNADNQRDSILKKRAMHGISNRLLTDAQVLEIRSDRRSYSKIAAQYGVSKSVIIAVKKLRSYREV